MVSDVSIDGMFVSEAQSRVRWMEGKKARRELNFLPGGSRHVYRPEARKGNLNFVY